MREGASRSGRAKGRIAANGGEADPARGGRTRHLDPLELCSATRARNSRQLETHLHSGVAGGAPDSFTEGAYLSFSVRVTYV